MFTNSNVDAFMVPPFNFRKLFLIIAGGTMIKYIVDRNMGR